MLAARVDTESLPEVASRFGIRGIPTLILFREGKEAKCMSGAIPAQETAARLSI